MTLPRFSIDLGQQAAHELLSHSPGLTAISCYNDLAAIGVLQAAQALGRRVPEDLAIVGFDDLPVSSLITPQLTSIHVPRHRLGQMLMEILLHVVVAKGRHEEQREISIEMMIRNSCGARLIQPLLS
jgi:DNA-binding LacI/PurR family transcriptional regulator